MSALPRLTFDENPLIGQETSVRCTHLLVSDPDLWAKNKRGPGLLPRIRLWSVLRGLNLDSLEKLCNGLFPRTNKIVCNEGGGGERLAYCRDAMIDHLSFWRP